MIDIRQDQLKAAVLAYRVADRQLKAAIRDATRDTAAPLWKAEVSRRTSSRAQDEAVLGRGARFKAGNPPQLIAATSKRALSGGMVPAAQWAAIEFGAGKNRETFIEYRARSRRGTRHTVRRRVLRGLPARNSSGRIIYAAVQTVAPKVISAWLVTTVAAYREASNA